jgi:hypothetical protein
VAQQPSLQKRCHIGISRLATRKRLVKQPFPGVLAGSWYVCVRIQTTHIAGDFSFQAIHPDRSKATGNATRI